MRKKERFVLGKRTFRSQKSKHFVLRIISAMVRRYINIYSNEGYEIYLVHPFTIILLGGIKRLLGLDPIIADHLYLQMVYIVSGFLFILCVNVYVLKTYNYIWSLVNRVF